jgi:laminin beta 1
MRAIRDHQVIALLIVASMLAQCAYQQRINQPTQANNKTNRTPSRVAASCDLGDCYPATGDLLIGRTKFLSTSSTCGIDNPERYCVLGTTPDSTKCFVCDSRESYDPVVNNKSHMVENIVSRKQTDRFDRWWQSENGVESVQLRFDLEAPFAFTHIIMTFKTFRPAAMIIEKSSDFGRTWKPHGYFASNCAESFPDISTYLPKNLEDVYCESKYSSDTPSTKGEIVFKILPPTLIQTRDPYSKGVQDLLRITNLRVNFTKLHTFGDDLLDTRDEIREKYYYALYEMVVRGSCLCNGHSNKCMPVKDARYDSDTAGMVHGQCVCQHNTDGVNCERCLPLYNDRPWMAARAGKTNECKRCECNNHATECHFDETVFRDKGQTSGGVCDSCQHNTYGINCEKCKEDFWRDPKKGIDDAHTCKRNKNFLSFFFYFCLDITIKFDSL